MEESGGSNFDFDVNSQTNDDPADSDLHLPGSVKIPLKNKYKGL
jgi:hypothetical protein